MSICLEKQKIQCGMVSRAARHIAIDENSGKIAVVRKSRSSEIHDYVEFYNILSGWLAVPELTVCPENGSIEHLLFVEKGELMTSHANGSVCFIDPHNMGRVKRIQISASSIWAACKHDEAKSSIAMVSHSSVLYFFDVSSKMITSSISLGVESRLFDVSSNGSLVAIGSIDGIILAGDGRVQQTLKLDRQNRRDPTIAWSVLFIKPTLLACGDSRGTVTLWNPADGSLIQSISCLQSHILSMVTADGALNVAGVDPRITELKAVNGTYEIVNRRNGPVRDVRSMAVYENIVYAAGEDFDICVCKSGCRKLLFHQQKNLIVAQDIVACAGENYIDIFWKQNGEDEPSEGSNVLQQHYEMIHLAKIFTPKKRIITCWTISPCGQYVVIGTCNDTTIYKILPMAKKLSKKVLKTATLDVIATSFSITRGLRLFVAKNDFEIFEFELKKENGKELKNIVSQTDCGSVIKMRDSLCGKYLCVLTTRSQIFSINTENGDSRLLKVDLPIDFTLTSTSAFVLTTVTSIDSNQDTKKIMYEVGLSNGLIKRSASSHQLRMLPNSPKSTIPGQPIYLFSVNNSNVMMVSYDGHWSIVNIDAGTVVSAQDGPLKANKKTWRQDKPEVSEPLIISGIRLREELKEDEGVSSTKRTRRTSTRNETTFHSMNSRVLQLEVSGDEVPKTAGFKLKKFGMQ